MKTEDLILIAAAAFAIWAFRQWKGGATTTDQSANKYGATLVREWAGWKYYSDGTAIGPDGAYYLHGQLVYQP